MGNYAIILGVDQYKNAQELQSCGNDANLMEGFLKATGKYKVLRIPNNTTKHQAQEAITSFLPTDGTEVKEVLFYFSGHGKQDESDMHYVLYATDVNKINSTSLNNTELDDIIRKCSPKLYVKIVDACQSGVTYIKDIENTADGLEGIVSKGFENCIFISSSLKTQSSYTGSPYSKFTKSVIDAVENVSASLVKFTDIQNYLSDIFNTTETSQTPYFSTQCDGTEVFCEKNSDVLEYLNTLHPTTIPIKDSSQSNIEAVRAYLNKCKEDSVVKALMEKIQTSLNGWTLKHRLLNEFYECKCITDFPHVHRN